MPCTYDAIMKTLVRIGSLVLILAPFIGCGDDSREPDDDVARQSSALGASAAPEDGEPKVAVEEDAESGATEDDADGVVFEGEAGDGSTVVEGDAVGAAGPVQGDPTYIVYLLPLSDSNLYVAVRSFLDAHHSLATKLPPHVSVTGFFDKSWSPFTAGSRFRRAVISVGTPFGPPPRITHVGCTTTANGKNWLVYLKVSPMGPRWQNFVNAVNSWLQVPASRRKSLGSWHITLFEASRASTTKTRFNSVCASAQSRFKGKTYSHNPWGTALFQKTASGGVVQVPDTGFQVTK